MKKNVPTPRLAPKGGKKPGAAAPPTEVSVNPPATTNPPVASPLLRKR